MARESTSRAGIMAKEGLDVVEKIDRFVEEPEAAEAGCREHGDENERTHGQIAG